MMLGGMQMAAMSDLGVARRLFMSAGLVVLGGLAMVLCGVLAMFGSLLVVFVNFVISHCYRFEARTLCRAQTFEA